MNAVDLHIRKPEPLHPLLEFQNFGYSPCIVKEFFDGLLIEKAIEHDIEELVCCQVFAIEPHLADLADFDVVDELVL